MPILLQGHAHNERLSFVKASPTLASAALPLLGSVTEGFVAASAPLVW